MRTSESVDKILPVLFKLQPQFEVIEKTKDNTYFKSKYADLTDVIEACKKLLNGAGILVLQTVDYELANETIYDYLETRLIHVESGQWVAGRMRLLVEKNNMQQIGSAVTYSRRYALQTLVFLTAEDDDGNAASGKKNISTKPAATSSKPRPGGGFGRTATKTEKKEDDKTKTKNVDEAGMSFQEVVKVGDVFDAMKEEPKVEDTPKEEKKESEGLDKSKRKGSFRS